MRNATYFTKKELDLFNSLDPIFNEAQMKFINRKTPDSAIEIKTDKNGFKYKSIKASYAKAFVNLVTGGNYSFSVIEREYVTTSKEAIALCRLSINVNGMAYKREQFGQHHMTIKTDVKYKHTTSYVADIGNGYKAAASDGFKKCASEFGFFWDIYGQEHAEQKKSEQPELDHAEIKKLERLEHFLEAAKTTSEIKSTYNTFLDTSQETEESKALLKKHMDRVINSKPY